MFSFSTSLNIWAETSGNVPSGMWAQRKFWSACAHAQSDQNLQCADSLGDLRFPLGAHVRRYITDVAARILLCSCACAIPSGHMACKQRRIDITSTMLMRRCIHVMCLLSSGHMTFMQRRLNIDVVSTLRRHYIKVMWPLGGSLFLRWWSLLILRSRYATFSVLLFSPHFSIISTGSRRSYVISPLICILFTFIQITVWVSTLFLKNLAFFQNKLSRCQVIFEPQREKTYLCYVRPTKTQIRLRIRAVWLESSFSAWGIFASLAIQNALSEDYDQTVRMRRLI